MNRNDGDTSEEVKPNYEDLIREMEDFKKIIANRTEYYRELISAPFNSLRKSFDDLDVNIIEPLREQLRVTGILIGESDSRIDELNERLKYIQIRYEKIRNELNELMAKLSNPAYSFHPSKISFLPTQIIEEINEAKEKSAQDSNELDESEEFEDILNFNPEEDLCVAPAHSALKLVMDIGILENDINCLSEFVTKIIRNYQVFNKKD